MDRDSDQVFNQSGELLDHNLFSTHSGEAPLNSIREGSGNIMCLDVLRARPLIAGCYTQQSP